MRQLLLTVTHPGLTHTARVEATVVVLHRDPAVRQLLREALAECGYRVQALTPDARALPSAAWLDNGRWVLAFLDVWDLGTALAAHLRPRTGHRVPIVALTAWPDHPLLDTAEVAAVLSLPFEVDELLTLANRFASQARRRGPQVG